MTLPEMAALSLTVGALIAVAAWLNASNIDRGIDVIEKDLAGRLKLLRLKPARLRWWILIWLLILITSFFLVWIASGAFPLGAALAVLLGVAPWVVTYRMTVLRREKIEDQLADAMVMFSSGIRAGLSIAQALELLAQDCPKPIRQEFAQMIGEYQLGKPLERMLEEAKERLRSDNFILFAAALLASRESGGRLNETVERIAHSILELQRLERKVQSETAQAKKSAIYMAVIPPFILVAYAWLDPNNVSLLFTTLPGQLILATAVMLDVIAYFWAVKILNPDI